MAISPSDFGFDTTNLENLRGGTPDVNAKIILDILNGNDLGPKRDIVVLNAGAGILVGGKTDSLEEGIKYADESIKSRNALNKLNQLIAVK